jgi:polyphosphate kinase
MEPGAVGCAEVQVKMSELGHIAPDSPAALINRELSWLSFARRVLALAEDPGQPLLERVKLAGIMGMIYDEFAMKRIAGLFRQVRRNEGRRGSEGLTPPEVLLSANPELAVHAAAVFNELAAGYCFENGGTPEFFIGSADWMTRNLSRRMEAVAPVCDPVVKAELVSRS